MFRVDDFKLVYIFIHNHWFFTKYKIAIESSFAHLGIVDSKDILKVLIAMKHSHSLRNMQKLPERFLKSNLNLVLSPRMVHEICFCFVMWRVTYSQYLLHSFCTYKQGHHNGYASYISILDLIFWLKFLAALLTLFQMMKKSARVSSWFNGWRYRHNYVMYHNRDHRKAATVTQDLNASCNYARIV